MGLSSLGGGGGAACYPGLSRNFLSPLEAPAPPPPKSEAWILATTGLGACGPGCSSSFRGHPVPSCSVHLLTSGNHSHQPFLSNLERIHTPLLTLELQAALPGRNKCCPISRGRHGGCRGTLSTAGFCMNHAPHDHKQPRPPSTWEGKSQGPQQLWGTLLCAIVQAGSQVTQVGLEPLDLPAP